MTSSQTFDLSGRLVLVTGATRGVGRAVAICAAAVGAELIITGRTTGALEEVDDAIPADRRHSHDCRDGYEGLSGDAAPCRSNPRTVGAA